MTSLLYIFIEGSKRLFLLLDIGRQRKKNAVATGTIAQGTEIFAEAIRPTHGWAVQGATREEYK